MDAMSAGYARVWLHRVGYALFTTVFCWGIHIRTEVVDPEITRAWSFSGRSPHTGTLSGWRLSESAE